MYFGEWHDSGVEISIKCHGYTLDDQIIVWDKFQSY